MIRKEERMSEKMFKETMDETLSGLMKTLILTWALVMFPVNCNICQMKCQVLHKNLYHRRMHPEVFQSCINS